MLALVADTIAEARRGAVGMTMLGDDEAVEAVMLGAGSVLGALARDAIHLSISTISVALSVGPP